MFISYFILLSSQVICEFCFFSRGWGWRRGEREKEGKGEEGGRRGRRRGRELC